MGRNYTARYIAQQYGRYNAGRRAPDNDSGPHFYSTPHNGPPEGFREVIMEWLEQNLSPIVKRSIGFNRNSTSNLIRLTTNPDYVEAKHSWSQKRSGYLRFSEEVVEVLCYDTDLDMKIEYAHPQLFELLQVALSKFFNGTK